MSSIRDIRTEVIFKVPRRLGFEAKATGRESPQNGDAVEWIKHHQDKTPFSNIAPHRIKVTVSEIFWYELPLAEVRAERPSEANGPCHDRKC